MCSRIEFLCRRAKTAAASSLLLLPLALGCGGTPTAAVTGTVTWQGAPVEDGVIVFIQEEASDEGGRLQVPLKIENGGFASSTDSRVAVGGNRVEIRAHRPTGRTKEILEYDEMTRTYAKKTIDIKLQYLPPRYNDQSTLTREIQSGGNELRFDLTEQ
jgi:hypothetical protein